MPAVTVLIFHAPAGPRAGRLVRFLAEARAQLAEVHRQRFLAAEAANVEVVSDSGPAVAFGRRLETAIEGRDGGLVVLGSGAIPLGEADDYAAFVHAAAPGSTRALANNAFSSDIVAIPAVASLPRPIDLAADNALPRWLRERANLEVDDLGSRWRLQVDLDSPLDLILAARDRHVPAPLRALAAGELAAPASEPLRRALAGVAGVLLDRRAEIVVAGRTSATTLRWLETHARCRVRAIVEERGMRSAEGANLRPPRSLLGELVDRDGQDGLGQALARLGDGALVDTRVLLAHRQGSDEARWPVRKTASRRISSKQATFAIRGSGR